MAMAPYAGTRRSVSNRAFTMSVSVSERAQKNLGKYSHPTGKTRSMQMVTPSPYGAYGTT